MSEESIKSILENLKLLRQASGMTQDDLAKKIGVSRQTIINLEKTGIASPTVKLALVGLFSLTGTPVVLGILGAIGFNSVFNKKNKNKGED